MRTRSTSSDTEPDLRRANTSPKLEAYAARTETPLNVFALLTLWIVLAPLESFGAAEGVTPVGLTVRLLISLVFAVDLAIRAALAPRPLRYVATSPVRLLAVVVPPARVLLSLRLISSLFQRGHLLQFLFAAAGLLLNGALMVFLLERDVEGASIVTVGTAIWWGFVTVTTVGYGDMVPVTAGGRVIATLMTVTGVATIAVVTAHVASSFMARSDAGTDDDDGSSSGRDPELLARLDRIEQRLAELADQDRR